MHVVDVWCDMTVLDLERRVELEERQGGVADAAAQV